MPRPTEFSRERMSRFSRRLQGRRSTIFHDRARAGRDESAGYDDSDAPAWEKFGAFGAGLAIGIAVGAGAALLFAPRTGEETREILGEQARHLGNRVSDRWDDVRGGLRKAARRGRRKVRRGLTRSRWAAEDVADRY